MKRGQRSVIAAVVAVASLLVMAAMPALAQFEPQYPPGNDAFDRTWSRTDMPVKEGEVDRTWMWAPWAFSEVLEEPYADSPGGTREVQYFDKARMEINDPDADDDGLWYVTNGLLVVEMVEGTYQVGDDEFDESPSPADVQIVGDPGQEFGPTYASIQELGLRQALSEGALINQTINEDGEIVPDTHFDQYGATAAERVQVPTIDHTVAGPFWEFMNSEGTVWEDGEYVVEDLFQDAYYATGYPITEAYWATVPVGGTDRDVLWQCFERRCLSYTPGNPDGFLVEAGNVGQHYWTWRYDQEPEPANEYTVLFGSLNGSGVDAEGTLQLEGDQLTVSINASGLVPDQEHMQHIHGTDVEFSTCPTPDLDTDEDGIISIGEGGPAYGGVALPLEPYPTADGDGNYAFEETYEWDTALDLTAHTIVIHGLNVEVDEGEDPYDPTVPVACGRIYPSDELPEVAEYDVTLGELNDSGASGQANVSLQGQVLTVLIDATGLEAEQTHAQHIHGVDVEISVCPTPDYDTDEDGLISIGEGLPAYGGVLVPLSPFPTADADGNESFTQTYIVDPETVALDTRTIVLHGMTFEGAFDGSIPVACGPIGEREEPAEPTEYIVNFGELNGSGVDGAAELTLDGDQLTVAITVNGYTPEQTHMQHIHGVDVEGSVCPDPTADTDEDGLISITEGGPFYGGVALPLFSDVDAEEYPTSDEGGNVTFENTYTLEGDLDLTQHTIVLHGLPVDEAYDASVPVACGLIVPADADLYMAMNLSAENVPDEEVDTDATGSAVFWHDAEADVLYFMVEVFDLDDATAAHIHQGAAGESGGVIVPLFAGEEETSYAVDGILSTGRITADDLTGDLAGMTLDDLVALFGTTETESDAYVNVHSVEFGAGVIRDQINVVPE